MKTFETNFNQIKKIADKISSEKLSIDEVIEQGKLASDSAKICLDILKKERGSFKTLEQELQSITNELEEFIEDDETEDDEMEEE